METKVTKTTRTYEGAEFPVAGTWVLDPAHTAIEFTAKHLMVAKVKGHFGSFEGALHIAEVPTESTTTVTIDAASIDTGVQQRDDHLRSPDFLDAEQHKALTFTATRFEHAGGNEWKLHGDLTIRGITRPVVLETEYNGTNIDPWGAQRAFFAAETKIDREDWDLTWNQALETGGWLVSKGLKVAIEIEAVL
jgi:polyisoprenoid-binding protein YceI